MVPAIQLTLELIKMKQLPCCWPPSLRPLGHSQENVRTRLMQGVLAISGDGLVCRVFFPCWVILRPTVKSQTILLKKINQLICPCKVLVAALGIFDLRHGMWDPSSLARD